MTSCHGLSKKRQAEIPAVLTHRLPLNAVMLLVVAPKSEAAEFTNRAGAPNQAPALMLNAFCLFSLGPLALQAPEDAIAHYQQDNREQQPGRDDH